MNLRATIFGIFLICACQPLNNRFNKDQYACEVNDWAPFQDKVLFRLRGPDGSSISPDLIGRLSLLHQTGMSITPPLSKGGCVAFPRGTTGRIEATVPSREWALSFDVSSDFKPRKLNDLFLSKIEPVSLSITCPEKKVVSDPRDLWIPAQVSKGSASPGIKVVVEANRDGTQLVTDDPSLLTPESFPDGIYSIQARAIDLLGRSTSSTPCTLRLDSKIPAPPAPKSELIARADGLLEFSSQERARNFVCFEREEEFPGHCLLDASFTEFNEFIRIPGGGKWRVYIVSRSEAGKPSPTEIFSAIGDSKAPALELKWGFPQASNGVSFIPSANMETPVEMTFHDDASDFAWLSEHLECRVEFSPRLGVAAQTNDALCTRGICKGMTLETFRPCGPDFAFRLNNESKHFDEEIRLIVRLTDKVQRTTESSVSTWLFRNAIQPWTVFDGNTYDLVKAAFQVYPIPGQPGAAFAAGLGGLMSIGTPYRGTHDDGVWGGSLPRTQVSRFFVRNGFVWFAWGSMRIHRAPLKSQWALKTWAIPAEDCKSPDWMAADGEWGAVVSCFGPDGTSGPPGPAFRLVIDEDRWIRDHALEEALKQAVTFVSNEGDLWVLHEDQLLRWDQGKAVEQYPIPPDLDIRTSRPTGDRGFFAKGFKVKDGPWGRILLIFGTDGLGNEGKRFIFRLENQKMTPCPELQKYTGLRDFDETGRIAFQENGKLVLLDGDIRTELEWPENAAPNNPEIAFEMEPGGRIWVGTMAGALHAFDPSSTRSLSFSFESLDLHLGDGFGSPLIKSIQSTKDASLVLSIKNDLRRFQDGRWSVITPPDGKKVQDIHLADDGRMWIATVTPPNAPCQTYWSAVRGPTSWTEVDLPFPGDIDPERSNLWECGFRRSKHGHLLVVSQAFTFELDANGAVSAHPTNHAAWNTLYDNVGRAWQFSTAPTDKSPCLFDESADKWICMEGEGQEGLPSIHYAQGETYYIRRNRLFQLDTENQRWTLAGEIPFSDTDCMNIYGFFGCSSTLTSSPDGTLWIQTMAGRIMQGKKNNGPWSWKPVYTNTYSGLSIFPDRIGNMWVADQHGITLLHGLSQ